ncbi:DUF4870 domain-containing protein [Planomonospora sp. ID67723]|uniref:DUF4870 domain-containing protein n=1 Tax=Planomonospora sp. ID67723 TaxID=2738134 RepID=UPI0018C44999|nr:DUF4870 domain-containing protein [Planomonospora sp. ID67723]MBG0828928.1 DUF4870 domain-containing protein [Planomonospora sp. ID67723]
MSENPHGTWREPRDDDRTRSGDHPGHAGPGYGGPQPGQGYTQPGQAYPPPAPPYGTGGYGGHQDGPPVPYYQGGHPPAGGYGYGSGPYGSYDPYGPPGPYGSYDPYGPPGPYGSYGPPAPRPGSDDTTMAMVAHLLGLLTGFVGPLVVYLVKKDESPFAREQAAEALNFQLTLMIAYFVSLLLAFALIGFLLMPVIWIGSIIFMVVAAVAANRGERYRYPLNIRFVS